MAGKHHGPCFSAIFVRLTLPDNSPSSRGEAALCFPSASRAPPSGRTEGLMKLTAKTVAALRLPPRKTDVIFFDTDMPGFGYRLRTSGDGKVRRSWVVQYRRAGGTRRVLLGAGEVLTAEQARTAAKKTLAKVALGEDPQADKTARRHKDGHTGRALVGEYLTSKEGTIRPRTLRSLAAYLNGSYFKPLHGMPVDAVTRRDVAARLVAITREHGSIVAARARGALSTFYTWAMGNGLAETNPIVGTLK